MSRELDARVARVLGLDVVGEAWAWHSYDGEGWFIEDREWEGRSLQPIYLAHCMCERKDDEEPDEWTPEKILGHYPGCLEVVAFYSDDIARARAMEDWIKEHDISDRYANALHAIVIKDWGFHAGKETRGSDYTDYLDGLFWRLAHATPEQRCRAFLAAMGR